MKVLPFDEVPASEWDALAHRSREAWLHHRAPWVRIEAGQFCGENLSFGLAAGGRLAAILPLYLSDGRHGLGAETLVHSGVHRHAGLALDPDLAPGETRGAQRAAMAHALELARARSATRLALSAHNLSPALCGPARRDVPFWVEEDGFQLGIAFGPGGLEPAPGLSTLNADQIVDLAPGEEALFAGLEEACRRAVRKALRAGLSFDCGAEPERLDTFRSLAERSAQRSGEALPPVDYHRTVLAEFGPSGRAAIGFSRHEGRAVAGVFLLLDKGGANYLAGVSDPEALGLRPNDHAHWSAMMWAKARGAHSYRLGPIFPEVPADWAIARVSRFKARFGARSVPVVQGSLFLKPEPYLARARERLGELAAIGRAPPAPGGDAQPAGPPEAAAAPAIPISGSLPAARVGDAADEPAGLDVTGARAAVVAHHLRLFGLPRAGLDAERADPLVVEATCENLATTWAALERGRAVVALNGDPSFAHAFGLVVGQGREGPARLVTAEALGSRPLRALSGAGSLRGGVPVAIREDGEAAWAWRPVGAAGVLLVASDLAGDLVRFRQGDPAAAAPADGLWGFANERPVHLHEAALAGEDPFARPADDLVAALVAALRMHVGLAPLPVLPGGAPGAVIVTGDDDQAPLEDYEAQRALLADLPVTYFLHPLTRHRRETLAACEAGRRVEWGLHPDALEEPHRYAELLAEQAAWFEGLVGARARSLRNHGFLSDGYWGHLAPWLAEGLDASSNIPGLDGRVLTGSLLPARVWMGGVPTAHWSVLTAIGDGVVFIHGDDEEGSAERVRAAGRRIVESGLPGLLVLNLHPANHLRAAGMHRAARELVEQDGFIAWTLRDAVSWFEARDAGVEHPSDLSYRGPSARAPDPPSAPSPRSFLRRLWARALRFP